MSRGLGLAVGLILLSPEGRADAVNGVRCSVAPVADTNGDGFPDVAIALRGPDGLPREEQRLDRVRIDDLVRGGESATRR